jgi:predicted nucleotidyltransferase
VKLIYQRDLLPRYIGQEGDFLRLNDNSIFEVKGLVHPAGKLIAYPRYIPDEYGARQKDSMSRR